MASIDLEEALTAVVDAFNRHGVPYALCGGLSCSRRRVMSDVRSKVDMSPEAIAARIAEVAALNRLCESLAHATPSPAASSPAGQPPAPPAPKLGR